MAFKKHYFLGLAANIKHPWRFLFTFGRPKDAVNLTNFLAEKYSGTAVLTKNGRTALALALKNYLPEGSPVFINGFTCYAVVEAVKAAKMVPVYVDIEKDTLNFNLKTLTAAFSRSPLGESKTTPKDTPTPNISLLSDTKNATDFLPAGAVIVQNSLGYPASITEIENFAKKHHLVLIEDLAHSVGTIYEDDREAGTVGAATILSFGKEKRIDTILGGAVIFRSPCLENIGAQSDLPVIESKKTKKARFIFPVKRRKNDKFSLNISKTLSLPEKPARLSDSLRARFYPILGSLLRKFSYLHLSGLFMHLFLKLHFIEKSADNVLDFKHKISNSEAKIALKSLQKPIKNAPLRRFFLVENRDEILQKLKQAGFYFDGLWYETPIAPDRYYKKVDFPEKDCPVAVAVSKHILNLPTYYPSSTLTPALNIIKSAKPWEENL